MNLQTFKTRLLSATSITLLLTAPAASATVIYDNYTRIFNSVPLNDQGFSAIFRSDLTQSATTISARIAGTSGGMIKFVIFDLGNGSAPAVAQQATLLYEQEKLFAPAADFQYLASAPNPFTLQAGTWYAIGAISTGGSNFRLSYDRSGDTAPGPGFTPFLGNVNFSNYATPVATATGCCNMHFQLSREGAALVPEPSSFALLVVGFASLWLRQRRKTSAEAGPIKRAALIPERGTHAYVQLVASSSRPNFRMT